MLTMPKEIVNPKRVCIVINDIETFSYYGTIKFPDSPLIVIDRMMRTEPRFRELALQTDVYPNCRWIQKAVDKTSGGCDTWIGDVLSERCQYHEFHFWGHGFKSRYVREIRDILPDHTGPIDTVGIDCRLSDADLRKSATRMNRAPPGPCGLCGALTPTKACPCQTIRYCSDVCQRLHWRFHKVTCALRQPAGTTSSGVTTGESVNHPSVCVVHLNI